MSNPISVELDDDFVEIILPPVYNMPDKMSASVFETRPPPEIISSPSVAEASAPDSTTGTAFPSNNIVWRPLLLIIPLRIGLHEFNMQYASAFQVGLDILLYH